MAGGLARSSLTHQAVAVMDLASKPSCLCLPYLRCGTVCVCVCVYVVRIVPLSACIFYFWATSLLVCRVGLRQEERRCRGLVSPRSPPSPQVRRPEGERHGERKKFGNGHLLAPECRVSVGPRHSPSGHPAGSYNTQYQSMLSCPPCDAFHG